MSDHPRDGLPIQQGSCTSQQSLCAAAVLVLGIGGNGVGLGDWRNIPISNNVGGVKHFLSAQRHALKEERHFALVVRCAFQPGLASNR